MNIIFNGKKLSVEKDIAFSQLLENYKLDKNEIIVKLNKKIVLKENFIKIKLKENDEIDCIIMMAGG